MIQHAKKHLSTEYAKQETSMKQVASRAIHVLKAWVYIGDRRELQDNSSVPIGSLIKQSEQIGDKTMITNIGPEKGH
jgi:UDP-3-O-[3-hydroxymyristoyl] glucosamine N-acyltransferase